MWQMVSTLQLLIEHTSEQVAVIPVVQDDLSFEYALARRISVLIIFRWVIIKWSGGGILVCPVGLCITNLNGCHSSLMVVMDHIPQYFCGAR